MGKTVVIYKSKYGFTKKYAEWISESLGSDIFELDDIDITQVLKYDTVIFGGGVYSGKINGISFIKHNFGALKSKNLILFYVGIADPSIDISAGGVIHFNLGDKMESCIKTFYLRGGMNYNELGLIHKGEMSIMRTVLRRFHTGPARVLLESLENPVDYTDKSKIKKILRIGA